MGHPGEQVAYSLKFVFKQQQQTEKKPGLRAGCSR